MLPVPSHGATARGNLQLAFLEPGVPEVLQVKIDAAHVPKILLVFVHNLGSDVLKRHIKPPDRWVGLRIDTYFPL